ncbi:MAG: hypothetical protein MOB07_07510 [Acidobacteria bacterium]|nr:hypothetical protein [Acidobacteriota bacterium]
MTQEYLTDGQIDQYIQRTLGQCANPNYDIYLSVRRRLAQGLVTGKIDHAFSQTALPIQLSRTPSSRSDTYRNERAALLWLERVGFTAWRMCRLNGVGLRRRPRFSE